MTMTRDEVLTAEEVEGKNKEKKIAELKQKAIKASDKKCVKGCSKYYRYGFQDGYIAGAEPREKQIQIDAEQIRALQKQNGELTDKVRELEKENKRLKGDLELWESGGCRATNLDKCGVMRELKEQLTEAKDHIKKLLDCLKQDTNDPQTNYYVCQYMDKAEQFLKDSEVEK